MGRPRIRTTQYRETRARIAAENRAIASARRREVRAARARQHEREAQRLLSATPSLLALTAVSWFVDVLACLSSRFPLTRPYTVP